MERENMRLLILFFLIGGNMLERDFQANVIKELRDIFPDSYILKCDGSNTPQGFPDILILYKNKWAVLEFKRADNATKRPNQDYYINHLGNMSFARFIYPENKEDVLNELQQAFGA